MNKYIDAEKLETEIERLTNQKKEKLKMFSDEDDQYLLVCKNALSKYERSDGWDAHIISTWLEKRLKSPRPYWKPSEEQMSMLLAVINDPNNAGAESCQLALRDLYENLKKL